VELFNWPIGTAVFGKTAGAGLGGIKVGFTGGAGLGGVKVGAAGRFIRSAAVGIGGLGCERTLSIPAGSLGAVTILLMPLAVFLKALPIPLRLEVLANASLTPARPRPMEGATLGTDGIDTGADGTLPIIPPAALPAAAPAPAAPLTASTGMEGTLPAIERAADIPWETAGGILTAGGAFGAGADIALFTIPC